MIVVEPARHILHLLILRSVQNPPAEFLHRQLLVSDALIPVASLRFLLLPLVDFDQRIFPLLGHLPDDRPYAVHSLVELHAGLGIDSMVLWIDPRIRFQNDLNAGIVLRQKVAELFEVPLELNWLAMLLVVVAVADQGDVDVRDFVLHDLLVAARVEELPNVVATGCHVVADDLLVLVELPTAGR